MHSSWQHFNFTGVTVRRAEKTKSQSGRSNMVQNELGTLHYITLHFIWQTLLSKATYKVVQFKVIQQLNAR